MGPATELADSRDTFPSNLSEDVGEAVGRNTLSYPTDVGRNPVLPFDILAEPGRGRGAEKRPREREGAGLDATESANDETRLPLPKAGVAIAVKSYPSSASDRRQRQRKSVNAIDDLFQGLS